MSSFQLRAALVARYLRDSAGTDLRGAAGAVELVTDTAGLVDATVAVWAYSVTVTDSTGLVDTSSRTSHVVASDDAGLSDVGSAVLLLGTNVSENAGLTDDFSAVADYVAIVDDGTGLTDSNTVVVPGMVTRTDTDVTGSSDDLASVGIFLRTVDDGAGFTDVASSNMLTANDDAGLTDSHSDGLTSSASDDLGLTDSALLEGLATSSMIVTDLVGLTDEVDVPGPDLVEFVDDDLGLRDRLVVPQIGPISTVGGRVIGGTVTMVVPTNTFLGMPISTVGGTMVNGVTTGGTTVVTTVAPSGGGPDYAVHHGYAKLGVYPGYIVGTGGTGDLLTALTSLETLWGEKIEAFSRGLPNGMGDPLNSLRQAQGCPQLGVWAAPLVPMGSGSLALGLAGQYDAQIDLTGQRMRDYRPDDVLRLGWEFNGPNYNWGLGHIDPHTGHPNTMADIHAMQRHYVSRIRAQGFKGPIDINGGTTDTSKPGVDQWWPGDDVGDIVGIDVYNNISRADLYSKAMFQQVWDNEIKPTLDKLVAFARARGKYVGFGECGVLSKPFSAYATDDTALFWQYLAAYAKANCDVILYLCVWNQNQSSNGVVTEEGQICYSGDISGQTTNTLHNTSTHGPWYWTPSSHLSQSMTGFRQYMKTGSMQSGDSGSPGGTVSLTTGGITVGGTTTLGVSQLPDGTQVTAAYILGGTSTGGTLTGGAPRNAADNIIGGTLTGGTLIGGVLSGGTYSVGTYVGGTRQSNGTWTGGTLTGGTSVGGTLTGGVTALSDGSHVINGAVTGGVTTGGVTTGGVFNPVTGVLTGGVTVGGGTAGGTVTGGITLPPGVNPVTVPGSGSVSGGTGGGSAAVPVPGLVGWDYTGEPVDHFILIAFTSGAQPLKVSYTVPAVGTGRQYFQTAVGDVSQYSWVVYPVRADGAVGRGALFTEGWFLDPPTAGSPPLENSPAPPDSYNVANGTTGLVTSLAAQELVISYSETSNYWYVGSGVNISVAGHTPAMALDADDSSYWLSIGNSAPTNDNAFEWFEVLVPRQEVTSVRFHNMKPGYFVYISVFAAGVWVNHHAADIIPYNAADPTSHNGGDIPFAETLDCGSSEGPFEVTLRAPIPAVTKVRITFHQLQDFSALVPAGMEPYRAGLRKIKVFGVVAATTGGTAPPSLSPIHDYDSPDVLHSYTTYIPPSETPGAGEHPGLYEDYTDIVKLLCAWGGFYWPRDAALLNSDGTSTTYVYGSATYGLANVDPVLGDLNSGRVWGDFANTGVAGIANLPIPQWNHKSLLDGISYVRDIIGFLFYIDETGGPVWRLPNVFAVGNYVSVLAQSAQRTGVTVVIDESVTLMDLRAKLSSRNVRERYFIASTDGKTGALSQGYNANPTGLRRVAVWTDQHFGSDVECLLMADMIALRALMAYRIDTIQIPGYPRIQVDDQVQINERTTAENFLHYVRGISSTNDLETGVWTYDLDTNWLGLNPFANWVFNPANLTAELLAYLAATNALDAAPDATDSGGTTVKDVVKVVKLMKVHDVAAVYITDGITKRHVTDAAELKDLVKLGVVPSATPTEVSAATLAAIPLDAS